MAESDAENNNAHKESNDQSVSNSTSVQDLDNFYEELNKQTDSDYVKLKEMEEGCFKMRKEIALQHLEVASSFNPQFKKAESVFEANVIKAAETVQEIERIMSSELEEISKLLS